MRWTVSSGASWMTVSPDSGTDSGTVVVDYNANLGPARIGTITVTAPGATNTPLTDTVYQAGANVTPVAFYTSYTYDPACRLATVSTSPDSNMSGVTQEASYQYYASGNIRQVQLASGQVVNYRYNERDWLTGDSTGVFWEEIGYNDATGIGSAYGAQAQYNGNISWDSYYISGSSAEYDDVVGANPPTNTLGYAYSYDGANRLTGAHFGYYTSGSWYMADTYDDSYDMPVMQYDNDGNLMSLKRYGNHGALSDNLTYNYKAGTDLDTLITNSVGNGAAYTYDANGNMTSDSHNNITSMVYDLDNLPMPPCGIPTFKIVIDGISVTVNGTQVQYFYDANGNRIRKYDGTTNTYYIIGAGGQTEAVKTVQDTTVNTTYNILAGNENIGQVRIDTGSYNRYYYLSDHLGSVRVTVDVNGNVAGYNDFYPFGETMPGRSMVSSADPRYGYISVENDIETGYLDTGHRLYDPWGGMFHSVDRFASKYPWLSPYIYVADNPVIFVDPHGDTIDVSQMTKEQLSQYNSMISQLSKSENFKTLYGELQNSKAIYKITIGEPDDPRAAAQFKENKPGNIGSGGIFTFRKNAMNSFGDIAHEFFHAGQNAIGPDVVGSTGREAEAMLFERGVQYDLNIVTQGLPPTAFGKSFDDILSKGFDDKDWRTLIDAVPEFVEIGR